MGAENYKGRNGDMPLDLGWKYGFHKLKIYGGPFAKFPNNPGPDEFGVCLREGEPQSYDVWLPIEDFSVPENDDDVLEAIREVLFAAMSGKDVYVGCMGGWGRTGLFLSLVAKAAGVENPVEYVRGKYTPRAVETKQQYAYVQDFDVSSVRKWLQWSSWQVWPMKWWAALTA